MGERVTSTAVTESIRIAQAYLPRAPWKRQQALAIEICKAIELCEAEAVEETTSKIQNFVEEYFS